MAQAPVAKQKQRVRLYVATSADGFIADGAGSVAWLQSFDGRSYGYDTFMAEIGAVILGRRTYEQTLTFGPWPYKGQRSFVLTSSRVGELPAGTEIARGGLKGALEAARGATDRDIWVVGGRQVMAAALESGAVDVIDQFVIPVLLGSGIPLFGVLSRRFKLRLEQHTVFPDGVVRLCYNPA